MSNYLDDLYPVPGTIVRCKANIAAPGFTPGRCYIVQPQGGLIDDNGEHVRYPSARFDYAMEKDHVGLAKAA